MQLVFVIIMYTLFLHAQDGESGSPQLEEEERAHGIVSFETYFKYFKAGGGYIFTAFIFGLLLLVEVCSQSLVFLYFYNSKVNSFATDWWIADWYVYMNNINYCDLFIKV